ncbi:uncharacterized protein LOC122259074 isoform X2 [Penaeus japonicus]|uniref:uncharacterized protein LOC122259074 isoform X2 n=1 Tax=Penaeus japonicus TaxID=27405 RepID=UPI001C71299B|nr:uncharacterized protein LOC122259074 isoform X2 [Penaeus japonicus]
MSIQDEEREPLLAPPDHAFVRQKSIRLPRNRHPSSQQTGLESRPPSFHSGRLKWQTAHWGPDSKDSKDSLQTGDGIFRPTDFTGARFHEHSVVSPSPPSKILCHPPRPPPSRASQEVTERFSREMFRPIISFGLDSDSRAALSRRQAPSLGPLSDGARRYLETIRQTQQFSQPQRRNSYRDITPTRERAVSAPNDRFSRQTGSLRGRLSRQGSQGNESSALWPPSSSACSRTFVSDRLLESLKDTGRQRCKSGTSSPQSPRSPSFSRRCRSVTREAESPGTPSEERIQSFPQTFMQRLRRRSLSPSPRTLTPQDSPVLGRGSCRGSDATSEGAFKRHGSLPIPRKHNLERNWRSSSLRYSRSQTGELIGNMQARKESEACFALLPTPPSDTDSVQSPLTNPSTNLSNYTGNRSPHKTYVSSQHSRELQDSSSSTGSSTDESPSASCGVGGPPSRSCETDSASSFKTKELSMASSLSGATSSCNESRKIVKNRNTRSELDESLVSLQGSGGSPKRDSLSSVDESGDESRLLPDSFDSDIMHVMGFGPSENNMCEAEGTSARRTRDSHSDHIRYLLSNDEEYLVSLDQMLNDYREMYKMTPPHIRQHFDLVFKQVGLIYAFQLILHDAIQGASSNLTLLANVFRNAQFEAYRRYMIMTPAVQKELYRYSSHFDEHFPRLKRNILKPSMRLNFYAMALDGLKKLASQDEKKELQQSIDFLNQLKRQANTEITLATVVNSPVDLRLGGDMLFIGELSSLSGGTLQKKKYNMILFENMLVIVSSKMSYFKYKIHYRSEQLYDVEPYGDSDFHLSVLSEGHLQIVPLKFKAKSTALRDQWLAELKNTISKNKPSLREIPHSQIISDNPFGLMMPLSLFSVYPQLRITLEDNRASGKVLCIEETCQFLINMERDYIKRLEVLLHPEVLAPPESLHVLLEKLLSIYSTNIIPALQQALAISPYEVLSCLMRKLDKMEIYSDYLLIRSQLTIKLEQDVRAKLYIAPVQHLECYIIWLRQVAQSEQHRDIAQRIERRLYDYIMNAQIRLLTETIRNGRVDFRRSGNLIRNDAMDVKTRKKNLPYGTFQALLFQKVIILTRPKPPLYEYYWDIWLDQVNLGPPGNSATSFKLEVRQGGGREPITYEFHAANKAVKQEWIRCLQEELVHQAEKIRRRSASHF